MPITLEDYQQRLIAICELTPMERPPAIHELHLEARPERTKSDVKRDVSTLLRAMEGAEQDGGLADLGHIVALDAFNTLYAQGRILMFSTGDAQFWKYDGKLWRAIIKDEVAGDMIRHAADMIKDGLNIGDLALTSVATQAASVLKSMVTKGGDPLGLLSPPPSLLCVDNGELDTTTSPWTLHPHRPESHLRSKLNVYYDPNATAPVFEATVLDIMGNDTDMARHLKECMGVALFPRKPFASFQLWIGDGSNGKSVMQGVLSDLMGSSSLAAMQINTLDSEPRFSLGKLVGKSALLDDDLDFDKPFPIAMIKKISESKLVGTEIKGGKHFDFICEVTPIIATNDYPPVKDVSQGFVRRATVIPFQQEYVLAGDRDRRATERGVPPDSLKLADLSLKYKLQAERSGIFNSLSVAMANVWQRGSFDQPQTARDAMDTWRGAADSVRAFVMSECTPDGGAPYGILMTDFRIRYQNWCIANGLEAKGMRKITMSLKQSGYTISTTGGIQYLRHMRF